MNSILIVDDDSIFRNRLAKAFLARGYLPFTAENIEEIKELSSKIEYAVVDLRIAEQNGLDALRIIKQLHPQSKVVMLTGYGSITNALEATKLGAINYLTKPANADEILASFNLLPNNEISSAPSLARAEWEHIQRVLTENEGNISHAAKKLGIPRRTLQRKLIKLPPKE